MNKKYQGVLTVSGYPLKLYHYTTAEVEKFLPFTHFTSKSLVENDKFKLYNKPLFSDDKKNMVKYISNNEQKEVSYLIPVYLWVSHPKPLTFMSGSSFEDLQRSFICELLSQQFGIGLSSYLTCQENVFKKERSKITKDIFSLFQYKKEYAFIFQQPYKLTNETILRELKLETIFPVKSGTKNKENVQLNQKHLMVQRLIRFWEQKDYDGFVYNNGINQTYVTFREQQIKRLDRTLTDWHLTFPSHQNEENLMQIYHSAMTENNQPDLSLKELLLWEQCLTIVSCQNKQLQAKKIQKKSYQNLTLEQNINQRG